MYMVFSRGTTYLSLCAALVAMLFAEFANAENPRVPFVEQTPRHTAVDAAVSTDESGEEVFTWEDVDEDGALVGRTAENGDAAGPEIVHGQPGVSFRDHAFGGYIDPRLESSNGVDINLGINEVVIGFTEAVFAIGGGAVSPASFKITQTGDGMAPIVATVEAVDDSRFRLTLSQPILAVREWTTIIANVQNVGGVVIRNVGDLGPVDNEPDRIDIGFLPADVNQSGIVRPFDLLRLRMILNGQFTPAEGVGTDYVDVNRNGSIDAFDLLRYRKLITGVTPATQSWSGETFNNPRP